MYAIRSCLVAFLLVFLTLAALGQEEGAIVAYRLFAASASGPYESHNWGEEWFSIRDELSRNISTFFCMGPLAFAGGADGLYVSVDNGETWNPVEQWNGGEVLAILPASYFVAEPVVFVGTRRGLYRSEDGGVHWERKGEGIVEGAVHDLAWPGPTLLLGTSKGLFRSEDAGNTWSSNARGLPPSSILSLALSRFFGQDPVAFVGTDGEGLYRTRDGGESFAPLDLPARHIYSLYWWRSSLFACTEDGLYLSKDAGESWEPAAPELKGTRVHTIWIPVPDAQSEIILGTDRGVFKSSDGGLSWRHLTKGMSPVAVLGFGSFPISTLDIEQRQK